MARLYEEYGKEFFTTVQRRVLTHLLRYSPQVHQLLKSMSDPAEIMCCVEGRCTPRHSIPALQRNGPECLNLIADSMEFVPPAHHTPPGFTTASWRFQRTRWVFLTSSAAYREKVLPLHAAWLDLFILRMMQPCANPAKPVWSVLDELASLDKLPRLHTAVTENRKYGNPVVLIVQGRSQIEKRYGQDAESMALAAGDEDLSENLRAAR